MNEYQTSGFKKALFTERRLYPSAVWHLICGGFVVINGVAIYIWKRKEQDA